ncbi:MAG: phosphate acyltransferase PlsX [Phycisphaerae bacterium]|nr:phosphate acyltransferase PlsX [Phycisphaerae bacterium]
MRIAVDAMGGDNAPQQIIEGVIQALPEIGEDQIVLVGDKSVIKSQLDSQFPSWQDRISVVHASEVVDMNDSPVDALRRKKDSSIAVMTKLVACGDAEIVLSAGNTGAFVAASQMSMRLLPGVSRPGILVAFPTVKGPIVLIDVGSNVSPKAIHFYEYALMADVYCREMFGDQNPSIGLINIGEEEAKGTSLLKTVNKLLRDDKSLNFVGNIEPRELLDRPAEILVCDGFIGNIVLKLTEGVSASLFKYIAKEFAEQKPELLPHFKPVVEKIYAKHDYVEYGGAPLLGVNGHTFICHGRSDARAIKNAILVALKHAKSGINDKIVERLKAAR